MHKCRWNKKYQDWIPIRTQFDKKYTKTLSKYQQLKKMICENCTLSYDYETFVIELHKQLSLYNSNEFISQINSKFTNTIRLDHSRDIHPLRRVDFDNLLIILHQYVVNGDIERYVDNVSGLEVYNYFVGHNSNNNKSQIMSNIDDEYNNNNDITVSMCRGLIIHPASKRIIATSFVQFNQNKISYDENNMDVETSQSGHSISSNEIVQATIKYDGTLIIVFKLHGIVYASTRRRLDSQQAIWATNYIRNNEKIANEIREHWTYLFEMIGGDNLHVMHYICEQSLVFLTAYDEHGIEIDYNQRLDVARRCDVVMTPVIYGDINEVSNMANIEESTLFANGALRLCKSMFANDEQSMVNIKTTWESCDTNSDKKLTSKNNTFFTSMLWEGIVVEHDCENTKTRTKIICPEWKRSKQILLSLHPMEIWNSMRYNQLNSLINSLDTPYHALVEIYNMIDAILHLYDKHQLICCISDKTVFSFSNKIACIRCGCRTEFDEYNERQCFCWTCFGSSIPCKYIEKPLLKEKEQWDSYQCECNYYGYEYKCYYCYEFNLFAGMIGKECVNTSGIECISCNNGLPTNNDIYCNECMKQTSSYVAINQLYRAIINKNIYAGIDSIVTFERENESSLQENIIFILNNVFGSLYAPYMTMPVKSDVITSILRCYLLTIAKPSSCGLLPYYTPSIWLNNTYGKSWNTKNVIRRYEYMSSWDDLYDSSTLNYMLLSRFDIVTHTIFSYLQRIDFFMLNIDMLVFPTYRTVCRLWRRNIDMLFGKDINNWKDMYENDMKYRKRIRYMSEDMYSYIS
jgi:hypothetical protein